MRAAAAGRLEAIYALHQALPTDRYSAACDALVAEVACSLNLSHRSAWRLYDEAFMICQRRGLLTALRTGDIDLTRAKLIATLLPTSDLQERWEADAIDYAGSHDVSGAPLVTVPAPRRRRQSQEDRVRGSARRDHPDRDGMTDLYAYLPTEVAEALFTALDTLARTNTVPDDQRTLAQRRADAVADLLDEQTVVKTTVAVVLPTSGIGATVNGCPLPWTNAWHLACRTDLTRPGSRGWPPHRPDHQHHPGQYRIPTALARTVRARDQHCRFPGCSVPAARCDLDHTIPAPRRRHPPRTTCTAYADATTASNTKPAGTSSTSATTNWNGPAPPTHLPHQTTQHPRPRSVKPEDQLPRNPVQPPLDGRPGAPVIGSRYPLRGSAPSRGAEVQPAPTARHDRSQRR